MNCSIVDFWVFSSLKRHYPQQIMKYFWANSVAIQSWKLHYMSMWCRRQELYHAVHGIMSEAVAFIFAWLAWERKGYDLWCHNAMGSRVLYTFSLLWLLLKCEGIHASRNPPDWHARLASITINIMWSKHGTTVVPSTNPLRPKSWIPYLMSYKIQLIVNWRGIHA
jgi:hypothetical protein